MDNKLKKYLFDWLLENTDDDILIGANLAGSNVKFPFEMIDPAITLKLRYAKGLYTDISGVSAFISFNPDNNLPNEEHCFFPWESVFMIMSDSNSYLFSFNTVSENTRSNKLKLC